MTRNKSRTFMKLQILHPTGIFSDGFCFSCGPCDRWSTSCFCWTLLVLWGLQVKPLFTRPDKAEQKPAQELARQDFCRLSLSCSITFPDLKNERKTNKQKKKAQQQTNKKKTLCFIFYFSAFVCHRFCSGVSYFFSSSLNKPVVQLWRSILGMRR